MSLWGGRFNESSDKLFKIFNNSLKIDYKLIKHDIICSIAWSKSLLNANIINKKEYLKLKNSLNSILKEFNKNSEKIILSNEEDIHSWVEKRLIEKIGDIGKKLHTGRSRNDQIATDLKLWCKEKTYYVIEIINKLRKTLIKKAENNIESFMPSYTHLQIAQPTTFAHWCLAYNEMLYRDQDRLKNSIKRLNLSPLGSGALTGTSYPIDRDKLAKKMGFKEATKNSIDSVSDRDYILELLFNSAVGMIHLSRFAEDLIFFNTSEANFIELSDLVTSGSSLMPQKKNPDALELIRGKCGKVSGYLIGMMMTLKGLPMSYNKDIQEDKEFIFNSLDTWIECLNMSNLILNGLKIKIKNCKEAAKKGYSNATDLADYLVSKGISFRKSHNIVGKIVLEAINKKMTLECLSINTFKKFSSKIENDVYSILTIESCLSKRNVKGGSSINQINKSIKEAKKIIEQ
ncbi:MAG: argininosuccinate lyase [Candidatus Makana argininalis]